MTVSLDTSAEAAARALSLRLFHGMLATQEAFAAYLGVKLGLYEVLRDHGPMTVPDLADRADVAPRYAREWLEQQAVSGLVAVDDVRLTWPLRRYRLPPGHERVLTASADPLSLVATALLPTGGIASALPSLLAAFRTGAGLGAEAFGEDWRDGHGGANRAIYERQLVGWLRLHLPDACRRLAERPARILDVGCGAGWAAIALARAFPRARVCGVDIDATVVERARAHAAAAGVTDRVSIEVCDIAREGPAPHETAREGPGLEGLAPALAPGFDLVCVFDAMHELVRPVEVLRVCRWLRADDGVVLVLDSQVADEFTAPGDEIERFQYAASVLHCLPAALDGIGAVGTGTVLRADAMRGYAQAAGFLEARVIELDDRFHRLYRLIS